MAYRLLVYHNDWAFRAKKHGDIINQYFTQYAAVKAYMDKSIAFAQEKGYVETLMGRKRYLPDINSRIMLCVALPNEMRLMHPYRARQLI